MKYSLHWDIKIRANKKETALKEYKKIEKELNCNIKLLTCEKYWKIPELFEYKFEEIIEDRKPSQIVYETLAKAHKLINSW